MADLSIITVEYRNPKQIQVLHDSLKKHLTKIHWELIIISNSEYTPEENKKLQNFFDGATYVATGRNGGYAFGVNKGLALAGSPMIFVSNPDVTLQDNSLELLVERLDQTKDVGMMAPQLVNDTGDGQYTCRRYPKPWSFLLVRTPLRKLPFGQNETSRYLMLDYDHQHPKGVEWVSGAAMLVKRQAVSEVGGMDERFFLYMEDVDWCRQFRQKGWRVVYDPSVVLIHAGQHMSLRILNPKPVIIHFISLAKYFWKWVRIRNTQKGLE